jgi:branched-chain amino acid transport system substrate-binding protein
MKLYRREVVSGLAAASVPLLRGRAEVPTIRIGVLTDMSGPYRDVAGPTFVACVRQAVQEFGASERGINVEVITADPQNKPAVGVSIVRKWLDEDGVDAVVDASNSAIALAINIVVRERNKVYLVPGVGTTDLIGVQCSPNTIKWGWDNYMVAKSTGAATVRAGGDTWFFITVDYAYGHSLQQNTVRFVTEAGGRVLGSVLYPFPETTDFSHYLLKAKASKAKVVAFANGGADTVNCLKQAREFGVGRPDQILAGLNAGLTTVRGVGLETAQGLLFTESFYWDLNDRTRAFTKRVLPRTPNNYPNMVHAGGYASTLHYLKVVAALGVAQAKRDGVATVNAMKAMPFDDDAFGRGVVRKDGRALVPAYLFRVKTPAGATVLGTSAAWSPQCPATKRPCPLPRSGARGRRREFRRRRG